MIPSKRATGCRTSAPSPEFPRGHFALGYGGNGITFSLLAAQLIRDALIGRSHPHASLFSFDRR